MANLKILVADDEAIIRLVTERLLALRGHEVLAVASGQEAVAALERGSFDLVVTDIRMPGGGGAAVARAARERDLPVAFITGFADAGDVQEFLEQGVPVVRKPFTPAELYEVVERLFPGGG